MKTYSNFVRSLQTEAANFSNWVMPDDKAIELEYKVEYEMKGLDDMTNNAWPTVNDFKRSVKKAKVVTVTPALDSKIGYRSHTSDKQSLLSLIRGYRSYPEFRNEKTIDAIYKGFEDNKAMKYPMVLKFPNGSMRVLGGNTRMDVANHMGIKPKVLMIEVPSK